MLTQNFDYHSMKYSCMYSFDVHNIMHTLCDQLSTTLGTKMLRSSIYTIENATGTTRKYINLSNEHENITEEYIIKRQQ